MKKYLMIGAAALMIGASFTSCSKEKDLYDPAGQAERFLQSYADAFIKIFGQPAATQDWGFGSQAQARMTRGYSTNHNLWGDPNADGGKWNWNVPPELTPEQKLRVKLYFQYNPWLTYQDPGLTNFFVQQVYKGGTSAIASQSAETYPTGNGGSVVGGLQMDQLSVGTPDAGTTANYYDHVQDFNYGDYNNGNTTTVLNTGESTNNWTDPTATHQDQITLMLDSKSDCVGYWGSNGSLGHNDRCALVSAAVIDAWAESAEAKALQIDLGAAVVDGWNRSFVGLDYDGVYGAGIYKKDNNAIVYAKIADAKQKEYLWDGEKVWKFDDYIAENGEYFLDKEGNKVPYTINERNMFIGTNVDLSGGQNDYITRKYIEELKREDDVIDLTVIQSKIDEAALPCDGKLYQWTKNIGGRDHVYSDWIVTLTPATKQTGTPPPPYLDTPDYRIIAEDLTIADKGNDFDFNDVVFDVYYNQNDATKAKIKLQAAGGTLPLEIRVGGQVFEVHNLFNVDVTQMVNTGAGPTVADANKPFFEVNITKGGDDGIKLYVNKGGEEQINFIELTAQKGHVAAKVKVDHTYQWCSERVDILKVYPNFDDYVEHPEKYAPNADKPTWWAK
jgi:hypothetical protein